ncbi:GIN domain-containing protein [Aurantiacibacter sp. D1-12]|uniref:GIN domain-containing protein n=1 Tax=Aurantiacibacter sp. D1-12 TaxID=2993658 RepID=UPI00237CB691|nr:DUF2807 domain-containing protein [Aurantiacibacter sp. D1-12]MDE1467381.1 DUF2807 domain-containing protein [Aurantiacibacter sp. D1-12]
MSVADLEKLTPRQKEVLRLLQAGFDTKSIARELDISVHTVTEHLREARRHLGVSNSREAARILNHAEAGPPNSMGPSSIGVAGPAADITPAAQSSTNRTLVYFGAAIMILLATAALALTLSDSEPPLQDHAATSEQVPPSAAERNPSPYPVLDVPLTEFDDVRVFGAIQVLVIADADGNRARLQGPRALIEDAIVAVEDGTLTIRYREGASWSWNPGSGLNVVVWTPSLSSINVQGPGSVEVWRPQGESFAATLERAGSVEITDIDVERVSLTTHGSGSILATGSAREGTYSVGGAGSIDAMRLRVTDADITVGGAGSNYANVSGEAQIAFLRRGGGDVEVVGGGTCVTQPAYSDRVECR